MLGQDRSGYDRCGKVRTG